MFLHNIHTHAFFRDRVHNFNQIPFISILREINVIHYINTFPHPHLSSALHPSPPSSGPWELPPPTWTPSPGSCALWVLTGFGQREASREKQRWGRSESGLRRLLPAGSVGTFLLRVCGGSRHCLHLSPQPPELRLQIPIPLNLPVCTTSLQLL